MDASFCTCKDHACPNHPTNHADGCTRCIKKCLALGEIPSCFFVAVAGHSSQGVYTYQAFADEVNRAKKEKETL